MRDPLTDGTTASCTRIPCRGGRASVWQPDGDRVEGAGRPLAKVFPAGEGVDPGVDGEVEGRSVGMRSRIPALAQCAEGTGVVAVWAFRLHREVAVSQVVGDLVEPAPLGDRVAVPPGAGEATFDLSGHDEPGAADGQAADPDP